MRKLTLLAFLLFTTFSVYAADGYRFHIRVTDGRTGLLSNPDFEKLGMKPEQLENAKNDRVVVLNDTDGTKWRWLMLSWFDNDPKIEQGLAERGAVPADKADVTISAGRAGHFRLRCLRESCRVTIAKDGRPDTYSDLARGEVSKHVPLDSTLTLRFGSVKASAQ